jgi:hypothetical protein
MTTEPILYAKLLTILPFNPPNINIYHWQRGWPQKFDSHPAETGESQDWVYKAPKGGFSLSWRLKTTILA